MVSIITGGAIRKTVPMPYTVAVEASGTADDVAIQSAIDSISEGIVYLKSGTYDITNTITLKTGVSIIGDPGPLNMPTNCPDLSFDPTGGTHLVNNGAGTCLAAENTASGSAVNNGLSRTHLKHLAFSDFETCIHVGATNRIGFAFSELSDLIMRDITGTALIMYNFQQCRLDGIYMSEVARGADFIADHQTCAPGNSVVNALYVYTDFGGNPDYGIKVQSKFVSGATQKAHNFITFIRPQINCFGGSGTKTPVNISSISTAANAVVTTSSAHGYSVGDIVYIEGSGVTTTEINDVYHEVTAVGSTTEFTITTSGGNGSGASGTVNKDRANIFIMGDNGNSALVNKCKLLSTDTEGEMPHNIIVAGATSVSLEIAGTTSETDIGESHVKVREARYTSIHCNDVDVIVDVDQDSYPCFGFGVFRKLTGRGLMGNYFVNDALGVDNDARQIVHLANRNQDDRNLSVANAIPVILDFNGIGIGSREKADNDGGTVSKDDIGQVFTCANTTGVTFTLPAASTVTNGMYHFKKTSANAFAITLDGNNSETIDGAATNAEMDAQYDSMTIWSDGSNWLIISKSIS